MKIFERVKNNLLFVSLLPEVLWHLARHEMDDKCLSNYFKWVFKTLESNGYFK